MKSELTESLNGYVDGDVRPGLHNMLASELDPALHDKLYPELYDALYNALYVPEAEEETFYPLL